jgi:hypothetical protein
MLSITWPAPSSDEPHFDDYPSTEAYRLAWFTWRAIQRNGRLNPEEHAAQWDVIEDAIINRRSGPTLPPSL